MRCSFPFLVRKVLPVLSLGALLLVGGCPRQNQQQNPTPPRSPSTRLPRPETGTATRTDNSNLLLGSPSAAGRGANNFLVERPQYAMSYNATNGGPNWVAWHTERNNLGDTERSSFRPDNLLPESWQIRPSDYKNSGYDRGHVCPSGDRTRSTRDNQATFVMSNMLPQTAALNQKVWKDLEDYSRDLVGQGNELYTVAGGVGSAGRIGGKVNVPKSCWKVIVVLPRGNNDLARIGRETRVIAVLMPNTDNVGNTQWPQWTTTVANLQRVTGYDFLSALPDDIERALEEKRDRGEF